MSASEAHGPHNGRAPIPFVTKAVATGLFSGYIPWASGTFGTIVGVAIYLLPGLSNPYILLALIAGGMAAGVATSSTVAKAAGHQLNASAQKAKNLFQPGRHDVADPSIVVIDEIVGVWISLWMLPYSVTAIVLAFFAFRFFDIVKPPPARQLERLPNGWGIMLDDAAAGIYANLATRGILLVLSSLSITLW